MHSSSRSFLLLYTIDFFQSQIGCGSVCITQPPPVFCKPRSIGRLVISEKDYGKNPKQRLDFGCAVENITMK